MKRFWCLFLVGALSGFWAGCNQAAVEVQPTETEMEEDIEDQGEMMQETTGETPESGGGTATETGS